MIYRYGYYDPTEKQRCNDCGGSGITGFDVFDDDLDEWVVEKCPNCNGTGEVEQGRPSSDYD